MSFFVSRNFPFVLAPMVGLSHVGMRMLVRQYLPQGATTFFPTEMLSSRRLPSQILGSTNETRKADIEDDLVPQILGNEKREIEQSVQKLKSWGARGVDINMGCPVRKALRHNYGVALMGEPEYAWNIVKMTKEASDLPVSVKIRAGLQKDSNFLLNFSKGLEAAGADWICLHPRIAEEKRRGRADWSQIQMLKKNLQIPVVGNGDVQTFEDAIRMKEETSCDAVMIGRALTVRPWMMWQLGEVMGLENPPGRVGRAPQTPEEEGAEYLNSLLILLDQLEKFFEEKDAAVRFRFHLRVSHVWLDFGHALCSEISSAETFVRFREIVHRYKKESGLQMSRWSDLRY